MGISSDLQIEHNFDEYVDSMSGDLDDIPSYDWDDYQMGKVSYAKRYNRQKSHTDFYIKAVGVTYGNRQNVIKTLHVGDTLYFVPEENNAYDKNAILIVTESGKDIGYVSKDYNKDILQNIKDGVIYKLTVSNITGTISTNFGVNIKVSILNQSFGTTTETPQVTQNEKTATEHCIQSYQDSDFDTKPTPKKRKIFAGVFVTAVLGLICLALFINIVIPKSKFKDVVVVSTGDFHIVGLKSDGTVVAMGDNYNGQCNVEGWSNISEIYATDSGTIGLKSNGTVVVSGGYGTFSEVYNWTGVTKFVADDYHVFGLKNDGTVVMAGTNRNNQYNIENWTSIVDVFLGNDCVFGLKNDGTVVATGDNDYGQCDVSNWNNIVAISAGDNHTVGLKTDGTVVAVGDNVYGQCNVDTWTDIIEIFTDNGYTIGLKSDGTVIAVGNNDYGQCDVSGWTNIVKISTSYEHTVGLKSDGTVVAVGDNAYGQCNVSGWSDIIAIDAHADKTIGVKSDGSVIIIDNNW